MADQRQLAQELADSEQVQVCVSSLVANYAFGAALVGSTRACARFTSRRLRLLAGEVGLLEYWAQLAGTLHFSERRSDK